MRIESVGDLGLRLGEFNKESWRAIFFVAWQDFKGQSFVVAYDLVKPCLFECAF